MLILKMASSEESLNRESTGNFQDVIYLKEVFSIKSETDDKKDILLFNIRVLYEGFLLRVGFNTDSNNGNVGC